MNRVMKAKNEKRIRQEIKEKKEAGYRVMSHRYYTETLPKSAEFFWKVDVLSHNKMWWEV